MCYSHVNVLQVLHFADFYLLMKAYLPSACESNMCMYVHRYNTSILKYADLQYIRMYTLRNCNCPLEVFVILNLVNTLHFSAKVRVLCMFKALDKSGNNFISLEQFYNFYNVLNLSWDRVSVCVCVCVCCVRVCMHVLVCTVCICEDGQVCMVDMQSNVQYIMFYTVRMYACIYCIFPRVVTFSLQNLQGLCLHLD